MSKNGMEWSDPIWQSSEPLPRDLDKNKYIYELDRIVLESYRKQFSTPPITNAKEWADRWKHVCDTPRESLEWTLYHFSYEDALYWMRECDKVVVSTSTQANGYRFHDIDPEFMRKVPPFPDGMKCWLPPGEMKPFLQACIDNVLDQRTMSILLKYSSSDALGWNLELPELDRFNELVIVYDLMKASVFSTVPGFEHDPVSDTLIGVYLREHSTYDILGTYDEAFRPGTYTKEEYLSDLTTMFRSTKTMDQYRILHNLNQSEGFDLFHISRNSELVINTVPVEWASAYLRNEK